MKVRKAVIPAAGYGTRFLPVTKSLPKEMLPIIDKPTIQYIVEEAINSGIEEILIITNSMKKCIEDHFDRNAEFEYFLVKKNKQKELDEIIKIGSMANIYTIRQKEQKGSGDAIFCAKAFVGNEPFAILLGDDIVDNDNYPATKQMCDLFEKVNSSIIGVQEVDDNDINKYGIVKVEGGFNNEGYGKMLEIVEKPEKEVAPSKSAVLGRYILTPKVFDILENQKPALNGEVQLTDAIKTLMNSEDVYAYNFKGTHYDIGSKKGFLKAIIGYASKRDDLKDELYNDFKELYGNK